METAGAGTPGGRREGRGASGRPRRARPGRRPGRGPRGRARAGKCGVRGGTRDGTRDASPPQDRVRPGPVRAGRNAGQPAPLRPAPFQGGAPRWVGGTRPGSRGGGSAPQQCTCRRCASAPRARAAAGELSARTCCGAASRGLGAPRSRSVLGVRRTRGSVCWAAGRAVLLEMLLKNFVSILVTMSGDRVPPPPLGWSLSLLRRSHVYKMVERTSH